MRHKALLVALFGLISAAGFAQQHTFWSRPDIHGDEVVFTCEGDLWLGSVSTGDARRITSHDGTELGAHFSPDGAKVAFTAQYDGGNDVYVMPVTGGAPKRLTYFAAQALVVGWTPDGSNVIFRSEANNQPSNANRLYKVPVDGGQSTLLPIPRVEYGSMNADGRRIAYVPISTEWENWFHYHGGAADDIWITDIKAGTFKRLTDDPSIDTTPTWVGNDIYFTSERNGDANLFKLDPNTRKVTALTHYTDTPVRYPSSDGKRVVFQHGSGLGIYDPEKGSASDLNFNLNSDMIHAREQRIRLATAIDAAGIGPTGKRIVVSARGQIWSLAAESGDARALDTKPGARATGPAWSPDGKKVAYITDRSGEQQLWTVGANGDAEPIQLTKDLQGEFYAPKWSPDNKWLVLGNRAGQVFLVDATSGATKKVDETNNYSSYDSLSPYQVFSPDSKYIAYERNQDNSELSIWIYEIATGKSVLVSSQDVNSFSPSFTPDGKYLAYLADRELNSTFSNVSSKFSFDNTTRITMIPLALDTPSPFAAKTDEEGAAPARQDQPPSPSTKIDFDGIQQRQMDVPAPAGHYARLFAVPGRFLLADVVGSVPGIESYDIARKQLTVLSQPATSLSVSADGQKMLVGLGRQYGVVDTNTGPFPPGAGAVNFAPYWIQIDPVQEWHQIYEESWRVARDFFYDPAMHGLDWEAIHRKYAAQLAMVGSRQDLSRVLSDMVAELNVGHCYVVDPTPGTPRIPMGYLGADLVPGPGQNAVQIKHLLRGDNYDLANRSPLLEAGLGIKEGDYIVAIGGQPVRADQDIQALLIGTPGQVVAVTVNSKPSMEGSRIIRVTPLPSESALRYEDWVRGRQEYVRVNGGDNLAYVHVPGMVAAGVNQFAKSYFPNVEKDGFIYDVRYNGGGFTSSLLLDDITAQRELYFQPRVGKPWTRESWAPMGYGVAICNEWDFSDGELFSEDWKRHKIGPLIGTRTSGAEVGSGGGYALVDGGSIYIPNYGAFSPEGKWVIEGTGVEPDIIVEDDPAAVLAGRDPQLDKAIEVLKAEIAKNPVKKPQHPPFTKMPPGGG